MELTSPPPNNPTPDSSQQVVEFVRSQRESIGYVLGLLAVVMLACSVFLALRAYRAPASVEQQPDPAAESPLDRLGMKDLPKSPTELASLKRGEYNLGWVGCLIWCLLLGAGAVWLTAGPVASEVDQQRTQIRALLLGLGGLLGATLILFGLFYFYLWSDSLSRWLDKNQAREAQWVLYPLLMVVMGSGMVFLAIQPARAEERNNTTIRRLVYGSNFTLTVLLLLVVLVVANVLFSLKVPNKLDATESNFYTLADETKQVLTGRLSQPVTAYAILPDVDDREINDIRQLLLACQDVSGGKFAVKFLNPITSKTEVSKLRTKYPQLDLVLSQRNVEGAVVLATGTDERRHTVISDPEFFTGRGAGRKFEGEVRLFRELVAMSDGDSKPVVYFTQANREMSIDTGAEATADRKATRLREYLEANVLDVRPLSLLGENPEVPADAAVVVVADPLTPFAPPAAAAIQRYVTDPARKGRLLVLAGAAPGPNRKGMAKTGLEDVLKALNVRLGDRFIYTLPSQREPNPFLILAGITAVAAKANNKVALEIAKVRTDLEMFMPREVYPLSGNPSLRPLPLLVTAGTTWVEADDQPINALEATIQLLVRNVDFQETKQLMRGGRPLGVLVSSMANPQEPSPVAAVYGNAWFISDDFFAKAGSPESAPIQYDLIGVTIDWLRDRPSIAAVGMHAKEYSHYTFPSASKLNYTRLMWLPLGLAIFAVIGLGAGVWVIRRR